MLPPPSLLQRRKGTHYTYPTNGYQSIRLRAGPSDVVFGLRGQLREGQVAGMVQTNLSE
jgi:hypothetical protein